MKKKLAHSLVLNDALQNFFKTFYRLQSKVTIFNLVVAGILVEIGNDALYK